MTDEMRLSLIFLLSWIPVIIVSIGLLKLYNLLLGTHFLADIYYGMKRVIKLAWSICQVALYMHRYLSATLVVILVSAMVIGFILTIGGR